jgi:uncharacterized protein YeaO (DUF488 family)
MVRIKRADETCRREDGARFLVERLWPRGMPKDPLHLKGWLKEVVPSTELRKWFGRDPAKWDESRRGYWRELDSRREAWQLLVEAGHAGELTLLSSAQHISQSNAVALKSYLELRMKSES